MASYRITQPIDGLFEVVKIEEGQAQVVSRHPTEEAARTWLANHPRQWLSEEPEDENWPEAN